MSRYTDSFTPPVESKPVDLPVIDWSKINNSAPVKVPIDYKGPDAELPKADFAVITWTSAEWSAFDHVFLNSDSPRSKWSDEWRKDWHLYSLGAPGSDVAPNLWLYYQMVKISTEGGKDLTVLLIKSDAHLSHPPWIGGLAEMVKRIINDAQPKHIYSIGTAGGSTPDETLGDAVITNSAHLELKKSENTGVDYNNQTFSCDTWFPSTTLLDATEKNLFFPLSKVLTQKELEYFMYQLNHPQKGPATNYTLEDFVNKPLQPKQLENPKIHNCKDQPLLTTDYYYIATGSSAAQYCFLEMDDAVIAHEAGKLGVEYAFIRNISDPLVPEKTTTGEEIPDSVRGDWSALIYSNCGLYTSFNGALATWATIAGTE